MAKPEEIIVNRELVEFAYRDSLIRVKKIRQYFKYIFSLIAGVMLLSIIASYMAGLVNVEIPLFYSQGTKGKRLMPTVNPPVTWEHVETYAEEAAAELLSLSFTDPENQLRSRRHFFEEEAFVMYVDSVINSGFLDKVIENKLTVTAIAKRPPDVRSRFPAEGTFKYRVFIRVVQTVQGLDDVLENREMEIEMLVKIVERDESIKAMKISSFNTRA